MHSRPRQNVKLGSLTSQSCSDGKEMCQKRVMHMKGCSFDNLRDCLHGSGGPQVGEVPRLGGVKKITLLYIQPYNPAIAGARSQDY